MLKAAAALFITGILLGSLLVAAAAARADARADITNYLTGFGYRAPNSFEPWGYNIPGTAPYVLLQNTANWTRFSNMGNLGIGNGSTATFGDPNSLTTNYSDYLFQGGDVSQQPLDPVRELNLNVAAPLAAENNTTASTANETTGNVTGKNYSRLSSGLFSQPLNANLQRAQDMGSAVVSDNASLQAANYTTETAANNTSLQEENVTTVYTPENVTYAAYHPIWAGRPVNDMLYEHPLSTSISTYSRLIGLETPSGIPVNIAMRCLSYGY